MQYSPKLKMAMEEIKEILKKHDIGAFVALHTPGFGEHLVRLDPSYSCVTFNGDEIRMKLKLADFNGDKEKWKQVATDSVSMLNTLADLTGQYAMHLIDVACKVNEKLDAQFTLDQGSSHTEQNN